MPTLKEIVNASLKKVMKDDYTDEVAKAVYADLTEDGKVVAGEKADNEKKALQDKLDGVAKDLETKTDQLKKFADVDPEKQAGLKKELDELKVKLEEETKTKTANATKELEAKKFKALEADLVARGAKDGKAGMLAREALVKAGGYEKLNLREDGTLADSDHITNGILESNKDLFTESRAGGGTGTGGSGGGDAGMSAEDSAEFFKNNSDADVIEKATKDEQFAKHVGLSNHYKGNK